MAKTLTDDEIINLLKNKCKAAGGQKPWADANDLSTAYVSDVIHRRRNPGATICKALGYQRVRTYSYIPDAWEQPNEDTWKDDK